MLCGCRPDHGQRVNDSTMTRVRATVSAMAVVRTRHQDRPSEMWWAWFSGADERGHPNDHAPDRSHKTQRQQAAVGLARDLEKLFTGDCHRIVWRDQADQVHGPVRSGVEGAKLATDTTKSNAGNSARNEVRQRRLSPEALAAVGLAAGAPENHRSNRWEP